MPKMKSNKTVRKRFRVGGTGTVKRAQAYTSHNTAKRGPTRRRRLKARVVVDSANLRSVKQSLINDM